MKKFADLSIMHTNKLFVILAFSIVPQLLSATHSFYVGTSLSGCSLTGKRNDSAKDTTPGVPKAVFAGDKRVNARGVYGGALGGYLFRIDNFGIGPEIFYNYGKIESRIRDIFSDIISATSTSFDITHKISNQVGTHIRLGYFFDSYFLYTLLGMQYQTAYFEMKAVHTDAGVSTPYNYKSKTKSTSAFSFGLGAQKAIAENYAVGIECKFATFPIKNFAFNLSDAERTTLTSNFSYKMRSVALKLMYVF